MPPGPSLERVLGDVARDPFAEPVSTDGWSCPAPRPPLQWRVSSVVSALAVLGDVEPFTLALLVGPQTDDDVHDLVDHRRADT